MDNPSGASAPNSSGFMKDIETFFDTYLHKKVPFQLPKNVKDFIVKVAPYVTLILALIGLPLILSVLGFSSAMAPFLMMSHYGFPAGLYLNLILAVIILIMHIMAFTGLRDRKLSGWQLMYNAALVQGVADLISVNIVSFILNLAITMYFLFQVREYYK